VTTPRGAVITAAAGNRLTHLLFFKLFTFDKRVRINEPTQDSLIVLSHIVKFSRLLRPVGPGFMSQNPSPGYRSHDEGILSEFAYADSFAKCKQFGE